MAMFPAATALALGLVSKSHKFLDKWGKVLVLVLIFVSFFVLTASFWHNPSSEQPVNPNQEIQLDLGNHTATLSPLSNIYAVNGHQTANISNLITLMSKKGLDFYSLIQPSDVVLIKINEEWDERGGTDTDVLKQLVQAIINHPSGFTGEIVVADNGQWQGSMNWSYNNAEDVSQSTQDVVDSFSSFHKVSTYSWMPIRNKQVSEFSSGDMEDGYIVYPNSDSVTGLIVSYPKFQTVYGTKISFKYGIWNGQTYEDRLKIINLPVLKSHGNYGVSGAVKHYMGVQSEIRAGGIANGHDSIGAGGMGTLMAETRMPTLNIICAIWVNAIPVGYDGAGPRTLYGFATRTNVLAASTDPVALDYWASKHILVQAAQIIGYSDTHTSNPDSTDRKALDRELNEAWGVWLPKARDALLRAGFQTTTDEQQMNVYVLSPNP
jgi:hypothetical protein